MGLERGLKEDDTWIGEQAILHTQHRKDGHAMLACSTIQYCIRIRRFGSEPGPARPKFRAYLEVLYDMAVGGDH